MNKILIFFMLFLISCAAKKTKNDFNFFDNNLNFEEFKLKLDEYANNNPFPNIDN